MEMLAKFDKNGCRETTVLEGVHYRDEASRESYIRQGYIAISEEDFAYYVGVRGAGDNGTGYIRDPKTGKPVSAPPAPPAKEESQELPVDPERLAVYEAMAAQEERLAAYAEREAKGGDSK